MHLASHGPPETIWGVEKLGLNKRAKTGPLINTIWAHIVPAGRKKNSVIELAGGRDARQVPPPPSAALDGGNKNERRRKQGWGRNAVCYGGKKSHSSSRTPTFLQPRSILVTIRAKYTELSFFLYTPECCTEVDVLHR
ncbi:uncharacterized [Tachysurus ichikawai]